VRLFKPTLAVIAPAGHPARLGRTVDGCGIGQHDEAPLSLKSLMKTGLKLDRDWAGVV
jgi:hypothetical protein